MHNSQQLRISVVFMFFIVCYGALLANLFFLQIYQHTFFSALAEKQYQIEVTHTPERAPIVDRNKKPLAGNRMAISAFICPNMITDEMRLSCFLKESFTQAYERYQRNKQSSFIFVQRNLTQKQIDLIKQAELPDIKLLKEPHRFYPHAHLAPVIGITNIDNEGCLGIEYSFNSQLKGSSSSFCLQKDARSGYFYFEKTMLEQGAQSIPVQLTIDADLQFLVTELLQTTIERYHAKQGSVLVLDPNGEILVMANYPTFDPNSCQQLELERTKNYCIAEQYEIGSILKVFAALAALEEGVVTMDETIDCKNLKTAYIDGRRVNTIAAHGLISFADVVAKSNNIGIALVAKRLHEKLYDHYLRVGFGSKCGISLPGEQQGFVNPPSSWSKQSVISLSYGYEITVTLLQLARAFSIIANDGYMTEPRIISSEPERRSERLYSQDSINDIKHILEETTLHGTARHARLQGFTVMCKTGTANLLENGTYIDTKNSYSCGGIIQKGDYKRIIITYIKEADRPNLFASTVAVPLFEKVAQKTIIHDKVV